MASADNFAVEQGMGEEAVDWMNSFSAKSNMKFECMLNGYSIATTHFGTFEILSWKGEWSDARKIIVKASHKLSMKVLESGYHQKDNILMSLIGASKEYAKVYRKGSFIGTVVLGKRSGRWTIVFEKQG